MSKHIIVIGGGMCGVASAIALAQTLSSLGETLQITVYELRDTPSTFGGPVNLTPKALRCLDMLGVFQELKDMRSGCEVDSIQIFSMRSGAEIATIDYTGSEGKGFDRYKGWRVMRYELLQAMLRVAGRFPTVNIEYGKKLTGIEETTENVRVRFEDGTGATGDIVLGCDGIHSAVRSLLVEPERKTFYSGVAAAYGFAKAEDVLGSEDETPFFKDSALVMSRYGSALTTFCDQDRSLIYVVLLMYAAEQGSREGWRSIGKDQDRVRSEGARRTQKSAIPKIREMIDKVEDWTLYPIHILPANGKWRTKRVLLLGDAAHAMPPKGESIGHALEDSIKISRILSHFGLDSPRTSFEFYENLQRKKTEDAYRVSSTGWMSNHDMGAIASTLMEWITPVFLWWMKRSSEEDFLADPSDITFPEHQI